MKKILFCLVILFGLNLPVLAQETPINVIYIHGSNQDNFGGLKGFTVWMNRFHPDLKKNFEKSEFIKSHLLSNAYIKDTPDMLYWADRLKPNKSLLDLGLQKSKRLSSKISQFTRELIGQLVHDAVWLQKSKNMQPILEELHKKVMANYNNGEKTMLVGYSAGTFITLHYLLMKTPILNISDLFEQFKGQVNITGNDILLAQKYVSQNTCTTAAIKSNLLFFDNSGTLHINTNAKQRENALKQISQQTQLLCSPEGTISGVLNFGSPTVVFYSELYDANSLNKYIILKTIQNIIETDKFYLTVNYSKDPIAVPVPDFNFNLLLQNRLCKDTKKGNGFIYDAMVKGGALTAEGHRQYWYSTNGYTKAVAKAYARGYEYFYGE